MSFYALAAVTLALARDCAAAVRRLATLLGSASAMYWTASTVTGVVLPSGPLSITLLSHGGFFALGLLLVLQRAGEGSRLWLYAPIGLACTCEIVAHTHELAVGFLLPNRPAVPLALFAAAVGIIAQGNRWQTALTRIGPVRLRWLGPLTYPLYLLHQHGGEAIMVLLRHKGVTSRRRNWLRGAMIAAAAMVVQVEPMLRRKLAQAFSRRRGLAAHKHKA